MESESRRAGRGIIEKKRGVDNVPRVAASRLHDTEGDVISVALTEGEKSSCHSWMT